MGRVRVELLLLQLYAFAAADLVYVTDLPSFSSLAPCAQDAVSNQVQDLTESACPQAVTALESCACSQDNNAASVVSAISTDVLNYCSSTATDDVASASAVFSRHVTPHFPGDLATNSQQILQSRKPRACCHTCPNIGFPIHNRYLGVFEFGIE